MKKLIILSAVAVFGTVSIQRSQAVNLPFYDSIPNTYTDGGFLGASGVGDANWTAGGTPGIELTVSNASALSYPGLQAPPAGSLGINYAYTGTARYRGVTFPAVSSGKVYCSFLMKVYDSLASNNRVIASLHGSTTGTTTPECAIIMQKITGASGYIGLAKHASTPISTNGVLLGTATHLVVVRYNFVDGANNNTMDLWLDPGSLGETEANIPAATLADLSDASQPDADSLNTFFLQVGSTGAQGISFDEVRIGTTWAHVTPVVEAPVSEIQIMTSDLAGEQLTLTGTGGTPSAGFTVLTSTNVAAPIGEWTDWASGLFDENGNFTVTQSINPGNSQSYYRIRK